MCATAIEKRYDFVLFYEVENGNPNGDPDAGNMPRVDPETHHGLVTDVCIKRKVRNAVSAIKEDASGYRIYVKEGSVLNEINKEAYLHYDMKLDKKLPKKVEEARKITGFMCENFYDIRTFGAVMTTGVNCGQVRGPVQFTFSKSLDPVFSQDISITRMAATKESEKDNRTMGRKHIIPYAVYRMEGFVSATLAKKTGFTGDDLELLWQSFEHMFEFDHSASRGRMAARKLFIFEHTSKLGNAPAHQLFERITAERINENEPPRRFSDYEIELDKNDLPEGVTLIERF